MKSRGLKVLCALLALTVLLSGCSFLGSKNKIGFSDTTIAGQVESIEKDQITLTLGYINEVDNGSADETATQPEATASPADSAQPETTAPAGQSGVAAEAPTVNDDSTAIAAKQQENTDAAKTSETAQPAEGDAPAEGDGTVPEKPADADAESGDSKGVTASVSTFKAGNTKATLTLGDVSMLFADDGKTAATLDDVQVGSILAVTVDAKGSIAKIVIRDVPRLIESNGISYFAANEFSDDNELSDEIFDSTQADENTVIVDNGAEVGFDGVTVTRTSDASTGGDNASFYGVGSAMLVTDGVSYITKSTVTTDAKGGAGIFSYGKGEVYTADTQITTAQDCSGGLHVAGGGKLAAWDMTVSTQGESSAAIRSDKGGGNLVVDGGMYSTSGVGSPAVYSTADIAVNGATLTANGAEAVCVEGKNTLYIFDTALSGNMADDEGSGDAWTVLVYQSGSGDAQRGKGTFSMVGGSLESKNGGLFYTTNTQSNIFLSGVDITAADDCEYFLKCTGNANERGWGETGANGADCTFTANGQEMKGDVIWDSISELDFYMQEGSTLTGAVKDDEDCVGDDEGSGYCSMYVSKDSKWIVTGNSRLTNLFKAGTIEDADGKTVTIKNTDGKTLVRGSSQYTITVDKYDTVAEFDGAMALPVWTDYQITRPTGV